MALRRLRQCDQPGGRRSTVGRSRCPIEARLSRPNRPAFRSMIVVVRIKNRRLLIASPARTLLVKMHASLGISGLFPPCFCSASRATAPNGERDRPDAAFRLFEQLAHARIVDPAFR